MGVITQRKYTWWFVLQEIQEIPLTKSAIYRNIVGHNDIGCYSTIHQHITLLEKGNYVKETPNGGRAILVTITSEGKALLEKAQRLVELTTHMEV